MKVIKVDFKHKMVIPELPDLSDRINITVNRIQSIVDELKKQQPNWDNIKSMTYEE